jgi:nitrogen fixation protein FixH
VGAEPARRVEPWPLALAAGLAAMIGVCLLFAWVAARHPDPVLVRDTFAADPGRSEELRERRRAEALGLGVRLEARHGPEGLRVRVTVLGAGGARLPAEEVVVRRERPAEGGLDADFPLRADGDAFVGTLPLPRPGRWRLAVTATVEGRPVRQHFAVFL